MSLARYQLLKTYLCVSMENISARAASSGTPSAISRSNLPGRLSAWSTASGLFVLAKALIGIRYTIRVRKSFVSAQG